MSRLRFLPALVLPIALLAACGGKGDDKPGTDISIKDDDGTVVAASSGKDGKMQINLPGISANIDLPKINLNAENFDIDGVELYPGSTIRSFNVDTGKGKGSDRVAIAFTSPAAPASVRDYFVNAMKEKGLSVTASGNSISGTQEDGDPFEIALKPGAGNSTQGAITLSGK